ncbi:Phosphodiest-domain-containing protein [Linnemannia elongata AG-77]|uniref:Phosphodiest-domain-containing protein n=1 Tax=Linnemannia elongata AG-77 TaxID=1314771 RepID=A0A197JJ30_9FUNG|nr:Phosphodiest-domain-containing protein [Linnemannia elongata AG-77]
MAVSSSSSRPPSVIWSLRSNSAGAIANDKRASFTARDSSKATANQPRARSSSFINISSSYVLEENLFTQNSRNRKPWSWPRIKQTFRRQSRNTRISLTISGGLVILYILVWTGGFLRHHHTHLRHFDNNFYNDEDHHSSASSSSGSLGNNQTRTLREQGQICNPRIQHAIPLPPRILSNGTHDFDPTVIVLSFDGLRADYLKRGITPNFLSVANNGLTAEYMQPSFPTLTFPNHYSMITGLYPSSHGIVANMFYDPKFNQDFNYKIPDKSWDPKWWGGQPIWETAVHQNQKSAVIMWPGGESERPVRPTYHMRFKSNNPILEKVDALLKWIDLPREERPTVMAAYISEVDNAGHSNGPDSKRNQRALGEVDAALGVFLEGLRARNLDKIINLMLVSDHGMSYVTPAQCIYYDDYIDPSDLLFEESLQPHLGIRAKTTKRTMEIYHQLKRAQLRDNLPFRVYKREEIPARYHYSENDRIAPVVVMADPGYVMTRRDMGLDVVGVHGWDHESEDMRAIFMASGPSFPPLPVNLETPIDGDNTNRTGSESNSNSLPPFENVELYEIIARTVGLQIAEGSTDGLHRGYLAKPC